MASRRMAFLLTSVSVLAMLLVGTSQAASADTGRTANTKVTVTSHASATSGNTALSGCPIVGPSGHVGALICGTEYVTITYASGEEMVIIGTDYRVWHDYGTGWSVLQHNAVEQAAPSAIGVFPAVSSSGFPYVYVLGTNNHWWCDATVGLNVWSGWAQC
jgi:hypothetical protein